MSYHLDCSSEIRTTKLLLLCPPHRMHQALCCVTWFFHQLISDRKICSQLNHK